VHALSSNDGVLNSLLHDSLGVSVTLGIMKRAETIGSLAVLVVGLEDTSSPLTLDADSASHCLESYKNKLKHNRSITISSCSFFPVEVIGKAIHG
jgi:hypothetical protein